MLSIEANAVSHFVDRHIEEGRGAKIAYTEARGGRTLSYAQMAEGAARVAGALTRAGVRPEERVALLVLDQIEFPQIFWGTIKAGVIPVPLNTLLASAVYDIILRDSRAAVLFVSAALWDAVAPVVAENPYLRQVVVIGDPPEGMVWRLYGGLDRYIRNGETTLFLQFPVWWAYALSFAAGVVACIVAVYCALMRVAEALTGQTILPTEQGEH